MSDAVNVPKDRVNLNDLLAQVCEGMQFKAEKYGDAIELSVRQRAVVMGSETQLKEVFINIIDNAIKYTLNGGKVWVRVQREADNALALARYFKAHPLVEQVFYPGLEDDPHHELAARYLRHGFGCVLSVVLKGDKRQTESLVDHLRLVSHLANVGDNRTLIIQPAATTHSQLSEEEQRAAGVLPTLLRISAGIEHIDDLIRDFEQAFFYVKA